MTTEQLTSFTIQDLSSVTLECQQPDCGAAVSLDPAKSMSRLVCPGCRVPLWDSDSASVEHGLVRAVAEFIRHRRQVEADSRRPIVKFVVRTPAP